MTGFVAPIHTPAAPGVPAGVTTSVVVSSPTINEKGSVSLSLVETNTTSSTVSFAVPASKEGFQVYKQGVAVWTSNPNASSQNVQLVTLAAGQSITLTTATWDDTGNLHPIGGAGTFTVVSEFDPTAKAATVTVNGPDTGDGTISPTAPIQSPTFPRTPPKLHFTFG